MSETMNTERWNTLDSAFMAIGIRKAIYEVVRGQSCPTECQKSLDQGIEFLDEAKAGKALIEGLGSEATASFNGTYSPFKLTTDVIIHVTKHAKASMQISELDNVLDQHKQALIVIKSNERNRFNSSSIEAVQSFFEELCELLLQQLDPTVRKVSQPSHSV